MAGQSYRGDAALAWLLDEAGVALAIEEVQSLVRGAVSALAGRRSDAWIGLIAPDAGPALRAELLALAELLAAESETGLELTPAPGERLEALRAELARRGLDGFMVPRGDAYQSEYVPARADRMRWLTGFTGSAGLAVVLPERAAIFVDGRYTLQVRRQVDQTLFAPHDLTSDPPAAWIAAHLPSVGRLGFDPWLHTERQIETYRRAAARAGGTLMPVPENPIDAIWPGQPARPISPVVPHEPRFAGVAAEEKTATIGASLARAGIDAAVLTAPDSIAWLLNIRGGDVPRTPLPLSWAILRRDGTVDLFIEPVKLAAATRRHLGEKVAISPPEAFGAALEALGRSGATVQVDPGAGPVLERELGAPFAVIERLARGGAVLVRALDPCALPKAAKNPV
ncbi:MAG: aminopeptidase P family N-terminal domain-containing protein, partial [Geminicoccaceae bacterium]